MSRLRPALLALTLHAGIASATPVANFLFLSNGQVSPEGNFVPFAHSYYGRVHVNGQGGVSVFDPTSFHGFYTQTYPAVLNLSEAEYPSVFQGGWAIPYVSLDFNFDNVTQTLRQHCLPYNHWRGRQDSLDLTTLIRFDGHVYRAAQYAESQVSGGDTLWHTPWTTYPLPWPSQPAVIWVEGVARVKGVVAGQVTLLASDSLFIMGDLITEDTILSPCPGDPPQEGTPFGTVPPGSPNRIGLVGEKDIIIAATLENGFANGLGDPNINCGLSNDDPVLTVCGQQRRDVVITASLLALGCSFETEFWKTTAWGCTVPSPWPQPEECGWLSNTHVTVWDNSPGGTRPDCLGVSDYYDRRGTIFLCGSIAVERSGFHLRAPPGSWGNAFIGYHYRAYRHDMNLLISAPPRWPEADWSTFTSLDVQVQAGAASACGPVADPAAFLQDWSQGVVRLRLRNADWQDGAMLVRTRVNGQTADSAWVASGGGAFTWWTPTLDLSPWLGQDLELRLDVQQGQLVGNPPQWDAFARWNADGDECVWSWSAASVVDAPSPAALTLSPPWPNPFNPVTHVELTLPAAEPLRLEVFDLWGRLEAVVHDGPLPAGAHLFTINGATWPAGLHLLRVTHAGGVETRKLLLIK